MNKRNFKTINVKVDPEFFDYFSKYCEEVGQSKTIALTRILRNYLDNYFAQDEKTRKPL